MVDRDRLLSQVLRWHGSATPKSTDHRALLRDELRRLAARPGHTIGAHTTNHLFLPSQPPTVQEREILAHKHALEDWLGRAVTLFAYPFGAFSDETIALARASGFAAAVTGENRGVAPDDEVFRLPRIPAPTNVDELAARLAAVFEGVR
jgi:peptidoglycan/xylan/chitin deacetylase (PgdA/CDA1 family)